LENNILRKLPSVDTLINTEEGKQLIKKHGHTSLVNATRSVLEELRSEILKKEKASIKEDGLSADSIMKRVQNHLKKKFSPSLQKAINATGIILHTGLGRAVLSKKALEAIHDTIEGYCTLATDIETGQRGHRDIHLNGLLCELTGAEAATIVNNNAAATVLILNALAKGKEVIVSRGQLVEIGGSFRMPDVMESSGAILKEVGTTNKTHLKDYLAAVNENTGAIMRVHHSNYRILGFAEEPPIEDLIKLGKEFHLPVIDDIGSGALMDLKEFGLETEPLVKQSINAGVDVCCFSGDKLIGGPQSGVIVGKSAVLEKIKKNPLARALRVGKMTIASMEATLKLFLDPEKLTLNHPCYRMFSCELEDLEKRAQKITKKLSAGAKDKADIHTVDGGSQVGSGSVPIETLPTKLLSVKPSSLSADNLAKKLRSNVPPIFTRVQKDSVLFDLRTIQPEEDESVQEALLRILFGKELSS